MGGLGGFGGLCRLPAGLRDPLLVSGTDGVGTKLELAQAYGRHHDVGIDLVAMCVNDVIDIRLKQDGMAFSVMFAPAGTQAQLPPSAADLPALGAVDGGTTGQTTTTVAEASTPGESTTTVPATTTAPSATTSVAPAGPTTTAG